jgi:LAO/AO transport system kinase
VSVTASTGGATLADRVRDGDPRAVARMISRVERADAAITEDIAQLFEAGGRAQIVGVTGAPGSGKSTLVAATASELLRRGRSVGVIAVDPSSPYSGGAILGDRVRMSGATAEPRMFMRSMAARGALGGLARATADAITVLDAAGKDVVLVETVGVGQDEVDIAAAAHTTLLISVPGLGDEIQLLKAGVVEIADVHVVNKADRADANQLVSQIKAMLRLDLREHAEDGWAIPVVSTVASREEGIAELVDTIDRHHRWLSGGDELERRERHMAAARIRAICTGLLRDRLGSSDAGADFEAAVEEVHRRRQDPWTAARMLVTGPNAPAWCGEG